MLDEQGYLHVVAAVIYDDKGRVLVAQRPEGSLCVGHCVDHCAGLWEFPGGKRHSDESPKQGLCRELSEELGIVAEELQPLMTVRYVYSAQPVLLDVWHVYSYQGVPLGKEGQLIKWSTLDELNNLSMPSADIPVIKALKLPRTYAITEEPRRGKKAFLLAQEGKFQAGVRLLQFRAKLLSCDDYTEYAVALIQLAHAYGAKVLLNAEIELALSLSADGVHLTESRLMAMVARPQKEGFLVAASCHDSASLAQAEGLSLDFVVLSPVEQTLTHVDAIPIGWEQFANLVDKINLPVFALGGMTVDDMEVAINSGAQGLAGIRLFL